ncbi:MAG: sulfatase [Coraliomargaritaceae bacterium]
MKTQQPVQVLRALALLFITSLLFIQSNYGSQKEIKSNLPNIVLVMVDDLGLYDLNCYGYEAVDTPNANRLAEEGMRFTNAYAGAPVCSPSRAALISGQSPARLHLTNHISNAHFSPENPILLNAPEIKALPQETVTYAEKLRDAGYVCGFFGKWHLSLQKPNSGGRVYDENTLPDNQGFVNNIGGNGNGGPGSWFSPYQNPYLQDGPEGEYLPDRLASEAVEFIETNKDKPFLLNMWNYTVHSPIKTTEELANKYKERRKSGIKMGSPVYAGMIEAADNVLGRILDTLDQLGLRENTIVILTSDNGGFNNLVVTEKPPLRENKGWLYEGGLRVPMIVSWPGKVEANSINQTRITHLDYFPTFMDIAGIRRSKDHILDGESFLPVITNKGKLKRNAVYFHYPNYAWHAKNRLGGVIIKGNYKLLNWYDDDSVELYNLNNDISERENLAQQFPEKSEQLKGQLKKWLLEVGANMPIPNPDYIPE